MPGRLSPRGIGQMSDRPIRVVAVAGARPNFMKIAPLMREFCSPAREGAFESTLVHTGQHYDAQMSGSFFEELDIPTPDVNLDVGSAPHGEQTAQVLSRMEPLLGELQPDALVVVGDVNSTLAATLAAVKLLIPVAHVEAGLRSFNRAMPEEINRLLTDAVAHWLFTTEPAGAENLRNEGVPEERIHFVGNVMIDTLLANLERAKNLDTLERLGLTPGSYGLLTLHRPSNVDDPKHLRRLFDVLEEIHQELPIVFPVHPRTQQVIEKLLDGPAPGLHMTSPLGYLDFLCLMADAKLVLTDSGGLQEETTALKVQCLTLRGETERPVTVTQGTNTIVGFEPDAIRSAARKVLDGEAKPSTMPEGWDGQAAKRIVDTLQCDLERKP